MALEQESPLAFTADECAGLRRHLMRIYSSALRLQAREATLGLTENVADQAYPRMDQHNLLLYADCVNFILRDIIPHGVYITPHPDHWGSGHLRLISGSQVTVPSLEQFEAAAEAFDFNRLLRAPLKSGIAEVTLQSPKNRAAMMEPFLPPLKTKFTARARAEQAWGTGSGRIV